MKTEISCSAAPSGLVADIASYFKHSQVSLPLTEKTYEFSKSVSFLSWQWKSAAGTGLVKSCIVHCEHAGAYEGPVAGSVRRLWACALHGGTVTKSKFAWDGPLALLLDGHHAGREGGRLLHLYQLLLVLEGRGSEAGTRGGGRSEERRRRRSFAADRPHKLQCPCSHLPRLPGKHHHRLNELRVCPKHFWGFSPVSGKICLQSHCLLTLTIFFALAAIRVYQSQNVLILHMSRPKQLLS